MKKRYSKKNSKLYKIGMFSVIISIFFVSVGYSAFREDLSIADVVSYIEYSTNIKVSNAEVSTSSSTDSYPNSTGFNNTSLLTNVHLNDSSSWVKYKITIANIGNNEAGISRYIETLLPSNLDYTIEDYNLGDILCDDIDPQKCNLNAITSFYVTIKYKSGVNVSSPADYDVNLEFDFENFYNITYSEGICTSCQAKIIKGGTLNVTLNDYNILSVYMNNVLLNTEEYSFNSTTGAFSINHVNGDVRIDNTEYTKIEYIQTTGTTDGQYINTLYTPNKNTKVLFDGMVISGDTALFGARTSSSDKKRFTLQYISANVYRVAIANQDILLDNKYVNNTRYLFQMDNSVATINNDVVGTYGTPTNYQASVNMYLLAVNTNNVASNFGVTRLYSAKIYEGDTLIKSFIPVLDSDNVPCLYDTVQGDYYYNLGSGRFVYDNIITYTISNNIDYIQLSNNQTVVSSGENYTTLIVPNSGYSLPKYLKITSNGAVLSINIDYTYDSTTGALTIFSIKDQIVIDELQETDLEYLASSGSQYIKTGIIPTINTKLVFTHIPISTSVQTWEAYFGTKDVSNNNNSFYVSTGVGSVSAWLGGYHVANGNIAIVHTVGSTQVITLSSSEFKIVEDGITKLSVPMTGPYTFDNAREIYLFGRNSGNSLNYPGVYRVKSVQIYESDELIMDLIPKIDTNGIYCMYDTISEDYFYNSGTGTFTGA